MSKQQLDNYKRQLASLKEEICFLEIIGDAGTLEEYERESYRLEQKITELSQKLYGEDVKVDNVKAFDYVDIKNDWNRKHFTVENPEEFNQALNDNVLADKKEHEIKDLKSLRGTLNNDNDTKATGNVLKLQTKLKNLKLKLNEILDNDDDDDDYEELLMVIKATKRKLKIALANRNEINSSRDKKANILADQIKKLQSEYNDIINTAEIEQKFAEFDMSSSAHVGVDERRTLYNNSYQMNTKLGTTDSNGNPLVKIRNHGTYSPPGGSGDFDYVVKSRIQ
jgi:hypothetical protein